MLGLDEINYEGRKLLSLAVNSRKCCRFCGGGGGGGLSQLPSAVIRTVDHP